MRKIEDNIYKGVIAIERAHQGNRSQYTTDPTENRKLRIQQKTLEKYEEIEHKRGVF